MTLEEALREAAAKGLTHLTLYPVPSADNKKLYWLARATPSTAHSYVQTQALDPAEALIEVLKALPKAGRRAPAKKGTYHTTGREPEVDQAVDIHDEEVTAKVTEPATLDDWLPKG